MPIDLHALADFNLVALHGGFGRASRASGRPKATLSRRVGELEQALGVRLIERGVQKLRLTEDGQALHARISGPLAEIGEASEAVLLGAPVPRGRLRVSAPIVLSHVALGPVAVRFARAYPDVRLEIVAEDRKADLVGDGFDLVLRIDPAPDERLVGRRILFDERLVVASPGHAPPADLTGTPPDQRAAPVRAVLRAGPVPDESWGVRTTCGRIVLAPQPVLFLSSLLMVREAVLSGLGAGLLPRLLVSEDIAAGRLTLWGELDRPSVEIWALQSSRRLMDVKVRAFLEILAQAFPGGTYPPQG